MNYIFLTIIISLGLITSYEDFRLGKIRNKWILSGLVLGIFAWLSIFDFTNLLSVSYLSALAVNFLLAIVIGFLMWKMKTWTAGDAKLFSVYALLVPLSFYSKTYLKYFPSFIILFNTFLLVLVYLFIKSSFFGARKILEKIQKKEKIQFYFERNVEDLKKYFRGLILFMPSFLLFMSVAVLAYGYINKVWPINFLLFQIILVMPVLIFSKFLIRLYQKKFSNIISFIFFVIIFSFSLITNYAYTINMAWGIFWGMIIFMILFPFFHKIIDYYLEKINGCEIDVNLLVPGMILKKESIKKLNLENYHNFSFTGLSSEQIELVKKHCAEKNFGKIKVGRPFYFAIWLFIGTIVTILVKGSLLGLLKF